MLDAKEVREAAAPFERLLVRVPEAYPLLGPYEATRPGLLVLDADGRRVDALALKEDSQPAEVAKWLRGALAAPARERFLLKALRGDAKALAADLAGSEGVWKAEVRGEGVLVLSKPGVIGPDSIFECGRLGKDLFAVLEPEAIQLSHPEHNADLDAAARAVASVPGVWAATGQCEGVRAWVTRLLLDPAALEKALPGFEHDLETRSFAIPGVSLGPPGMKVANAVQDLPGVLTVRPALAKESLSVVGRKGKVSWPGVLEALRGVVPGATEKR